MRHHRRSLAGLGAALAVAATTLAPTAPAVAAPGPVVEAGRFVLHFDDLWPDDLRAQMVAGTERVSRVLGPGRPIHLDVVPDPGASGLVGFAGPRSALPAPDGLCAGTPLYEHLTGVESTPGDRPDHDGTVRMSPDVQAWRDAADAAEGSPYQSLTAMADVMSHELGHVLDVVSDSFCYVQYPDGRREDFPNRLRSLLRAEQGPLLSLSAADQERLTRDLRQVTVEGPTLARLVPEGVWLYTTDDPFLPTSSGQHLAPTWPGDKVLEPSDVYFRALGRPFVALLADLGWNVQAEVVEATVAGLRVTGEVADDAPRTLAWDASDAATQGYDVYLWGTGEDDRGQPAGSDRYDDPSAWRHVALDAADRSVPIGDDVVEARVHVVGTDTSGPSVRIDTRRDRVLPARAGRLAGVNRYETAAAVARDGWARADTDTVFLATGRDFPDALAAAAAAGAVDQPVLLTAPTSLPEVTARELDRLRPATIVVLGRSGAVADDVAEAAARAAGGARVTRLGGDDRYATAAAIAAERYAEAEVVYLATGRDFPDALAGTVAAIGDRAPILLVGGTLPDAARAQLRRLAPREVVVLGGEQAVPDEVARAAARAAGGATLTRLGGDDRFATARRVAARAFPDGSRLVTLATGRDFPDALAGAVLAARTGPVLLVEPRVATPAPVLAAAEATGALGLVTLGSSGAVTGRTVQTVLARLDRR